MEFFLWEHFSQKTFPACVLWNNEEFGDVGGVRGREEESVTAASLLVVFLFLFFGISTATQLVWSLSAHVL